MTTHRSLNKLEYKAHMSIHNVADVSGHEGHESAYTRDRLGRRHNLFEGDGTSRIFKPAAMILFLGILFSASALAVPQNVQISSEDIDQKSFDDHLGHPTVPEKPVLFGDSNQSVGFNEDGDPSMSMRF